MARNVVTNRRLQRLVYTCDHPGCVHWESMPYEGDDHARILEDARTALAQKGWQITPDGVKYRTICPRH